MQARCRGGHRGGAALAIAALLLLAAASCQAGGYGPLRRHLRKSAADVPEHLRTLNHKPAPLLNESDLPKTFDWCDMDGVNYCVANWNQHIPKYCGSCFLHATLSAIADRLKIAKGGRAPDVMLGRQTFLNCAPQLGYSDGCDGGDVIDVVRYMAEYGLPDEGCMPYSATDYRDLGLKKHQKCPPIHSCTNCMPGKKGKDDCWAIKRPVMYKLAAYGNVGATHPDPGNVQAMMSEIYARGPITCSISCPDQFVYQYGGGIYYDKTNDTDVDHDIEVVGWGVEEGDDGVQRPYWKIRNSWGAYWGEMSFFKLPRGINAQQVEAGDCWYMVPTYDEEAAVLDGELVGSMFGLRKRHHTAEGQAAGAAVEDVVQLPRKGLLRPDSTRGAQGVV